MSTPQHTDDEPLRLGRVILLSLALVVGGATYWWLDAGRHMFFPKNWGTVEAGAIYRSGQLHPWVVERALSEAGIDVIVSLAPDPAHHAHDHPEAGHAPPGGHGDPAAAHGHDEHADAPHHGLDDGPAREVEVAARLGIRRVNATTLDGHGLGAAGDYVMALREIVRARQRDQQVLVHCFGGSERSGAAIAMYRMLFQGWPGERAYTEYLTYRKDPPESRALPDYVNAHLADIAGQLASDGLLTDVPDPLPTFGPR